MTGGHTNVLRVDPPLPKRTRLRLAVVRRIDGLAYWLTCHGMWRAAWAIYRAAGLV